LMLGYKWSAKRENADNGMYISTVTLELSSVRSVWNGTEHISMCFSVMLRKDNLTVGWMKLELGFGKFWDMRLMLTRPNKCKIYYIKPRDIRLRLMSKLKNLRLIKQCLRIMQRRNRTNHSN